MYTTKNNTSILLICAGDRPQSDQVRDYLIGEKYVEADVHFVTHDEVGVDFAPLQIETVRNVLPEFSLRPYVGEQSVYIVVRIDQASIPAQNAFLKSLEEPPAHVQIILTAENINRVLPTIRSRCLQVEMNNIETGKLGAKKTVHVDVKNYADVFALSEKYKERSDAIMFVDQLITSLHRENVDAPNLNSVQLLEKCLTAQETLQKNVNVRLVLEDLFFGFLEVS